MKRIICILLSLVVMGTSFAQDSKTKMKAKTGQTATPAAKPAVTPATAAKPVSAKATQLKKDGTPDMRTKENKDANKAPAPKLKKDGTPDMRYKENKEAAKKK